LNSISRELPSDLLLLGAKWRVELGDLEHRVKLRKLLGRRDLPLKIRRRAARSMLGYRWAMALREKPLGYPNLVKAREALMRKAAERRRQTDSSASPP
jgi:hypothetical protein